MHISWVAIGFIFVVALALKWDLRRDLNNAADALAAQLKNIESAQQTIVGRLTMVESNVARTLTAVTRKEETIEEQWLRENHKSPLTGGGS
jgi:hypothetical protein